MGTSSSVDLGDKEDKPSQVSSTSTENTKEVVTKKEDYTSCPTGGDKESLKETKKTAMKSETRSKENVKPCCKKVLMDCRLLNRT